MDFNQNNAGQAPSPMPVSGDDSSDVNPAQSTGQNVDPQNDNQQLPDNPEPQPDNQNAPVGDQQSMSVDEFNRQGDMDQYADEQMANGDSPEVADAKVKRLQQMNSKNSKLLQALGVDPLSDIADQLEEGLITPDMVRNHILGNSNPSQPEQNQPQPDYSDPVAEAQQRVIEAEQAWDQEYQQDGSVSVETLNNLRRAERLLTDARLEQVTRQVTARDQKEQVDQNVNAVLNVARSTPEYEQMDPQLRQSMDSVNLSLTASIADQEARQMGLDPNQLTPQQYAYFAQKGQQQLGGLAEFYMDLGAQRVRQNQMPGRNSSRNAPPPAAPNTSSVPRQPSKFTGVDLSNHAQAAKDYMRNSGQNL